MHRKRKGELRYIKYDRNGVMSFKVRPFNLYPVQIAWMIKECELDNTTSTVRVIYHN